MTKKHSTNPLSQYLEFSMKLVDLNLSKFADLIQYQTSTTNGFVELAKQRAKAANQVKDYDGLIDFAQEQNKVFRSGLNQWMDDCQSSTQDMVTYAKEVQEILSQGGTKGKSKQGKAA